MCKSLISKKNQTYSVKVGLIQPLLSIVCSNTVASTQILVGWHLKEYRFQFRIVGLPEMPRRWCWRTVCPAHRWPLRCSATNVRSAAVLSGLRCRCAPLKASLPFPLFQQFIRLWLSWDRVPVFVRYSFSLYIQISCLSLHSLTTSRKWNKADFSFVIRQ